MEIGRITDATRVCILGMPPQPMMLMMGEVPE
jgi:hypothetical protein